MSLLAQLITREVSGALKLSAQSADWRLLIERGQLNFATRSTGAFDRLVRHLNVAASDLPDTVIDQMRLLFEQFDDVDHVVSRDYRAICWLVEQQHVNSAQATQLIEAIAIEVVEPFLSIREGRYELVPASQTVGIPTFCRLDLRPIVARAQRSSRLHTAQGTVTGQRPEGSTLAPEVLASRMATSQVASAGRQRIDALNRTSYTVACIDDSPTVLNAIQKFLEGHNLSVVAINDPVKALMQIVRSKPDLVLLDITMPNLDGYELCALLRRHPRYKRTPIVMVTGNTGLIDRARAKLVRASGYLTKPFTQSELLKIVFKHLPN
ncbi:MAG: response regulator [Phormidesmis sp.]